MGFYDTEASIATRPRRRKTAYPRLDFVESGYRFYNPAIGRWCSRDPIGENGGRNIYAFVKNLPIDLVDVLGLLSIRNDVKDVHASLEILEPGRAIKMKSIFHLDHLKWPPPRQRGAEGSFEAAITDTLSSVQGTSSLKLRSAGHMAAMSGHIKGDFVIEGCCDSGKMRVTETVTADTSGSIPLQPLDRSRATMEKVDVLEKGRMSLTYTRESPTPQGEVRIPYYVIIGWRDPTPGGVAFGKAIATISAECVE